MDEPPLLRGRDRYERVMEGWSDDAPGEAFTHTVRLADADRGVEVSVTALPSPSYAITAARCRVLAGDVSRQAAGAVAGLAGTAMVGGLTRRVAELAGGGEGGRLIVDAVVEVARLSRQVAKLPAEQAQRAAAGDARVCWELDTTGWIDLPDSCFTYSEAGRRLLDRPGVTPAMGPHLYRPSPGQRNVFVRTKIARLERRGPTLELHHSMHDNVHGFEVHYAIDVPSARVIRAEHTTPRLPYMGICSEPQRKIAALVGETADDGLRRRIQGHLGGAGGCAQLYDLTADLLKLLA
ncbi:MAG: DUF2889 domain-containing protein [Candidatus Rokuibacteriota bacterium]